MKSMILIFVVYLLIVSCKSKKNEYEGYVYHGKTPLDSVLIKENTKYFPSSTVTNKNGYFKFKKSSENSIIDLIFAKEGYKTDTISLIRVKLSGSPDAFFLREGSDTLQMNLE